MARVQSLKSSRQDSVGVSTYLSGVLSDPASGSDVYSFCVGDVAFFFSFFIIMI
jgi:hypothetical protein